MVYRQSVIGESLERQRYQSYRDPLHEYHEYHDFDAVLPYTCETLDFVDKPLVKPCMDDKSLVKPSVDKKRKRQSCG